MLKVLESAESKPENMLYRIQDLYKNDSVETVNSYVAVIFDFIGYAENTVDWPNCFIKDSELNWIEHEAPIDDL
jgi:hypothetical protein